MPPARSRPQPDDSRSEASSTKEKTGSTSTNTQNGKGRRVAGNATTGSSLKDVVTAGPAAGATGPSSAAPAETNPGLQWSSFDDTVLHGYRYDYRLNTPAAFKKQSNQLILARSPIGRMSPTMARRKEERKQSKDQLANAVRKHFNGMGIQENEVVVDFLYKVRWQDVDEDPDKSFRMQFAPPRPR